MTAKYFPVKSCGYKKFLRLFRDDQGLRLWCKCVIPVGQYGVKTDRILSLIRFHNIATFLAKENSSRCRMA